MASRAKKMPKIPSFDSEEAERAFWKTHDSTDYLDWTEAETGLFPNLKPSTTTISVRLPDLMLESLKQIANSRDVPYQSLLKIFLAERIALELGGQITSPKRPARVAFVTEARQPKAERRKRLPQAAK